MYGNRQHAPHTTDRFAPTAKLAQVDTAEARHVSRGDTRRLSVVSNQPLLSHYIAIPDRISLLPLATLDLSIRLFLVFQRAGIHTVGQILELEQEDFERLKLGERSIQEVVQHMQAIGVLEPVEGLPEEVSPAEPTIPADPDHSADLSENALATHDVPDDAVLLSGHHYAWAVMINEAGWQRQAQWYLDIAPGTFPYAPGTIIEHDMQYYVLNCAGSSMLRVTSFFDQENEQEIEALASEESCERSADSVDQQKNEHNEVQETTSEHERTESEDDTLFPIRGVRNRKTCYEVSASSLPTKYRDRISLRQRTCWVETPEPVSIRPGYFLTRIGSTPDQLRGKSPIFLTEEEAALLSPISQAQAPTIKIGPAFLLPEDLRQVISSGISRPMDLWEPEGVKQQRTEDEKQADQQRGEQPSMRVPVPQHIARMHIKRLNLSLPLFHRLHLAGITRVGQLLEMEEDALRALSIGTRSLREIAHCLQTVQALPSKEALVYDDVYLAITDQWYIDEQQDQWRMVYVSAFPDRLAGWQSGLVHTVWLLQQHIDLAMDWNRSLLSLDTHTLRVQVNEYAREQGAVAPPIRTPKRKRDPEELELSASQNISIRLDAVNGLLDALPPGEETRRYRDHAGFLFGLQQEEWLALGRQAAEWKREQHAIAGKHQKAFAMEQVAACIRQVEDWYARLSQKPRILGLCGDIVEDDVPHERTYTVREKGKKARKETLHWIEKVKRLVGYQLVIGAPPWVSWPEGWMQKPIERQIA